jgi:hypothetical protein
MVEVLAIFAVLGWLLFVLCEWVSHLPVFPAVALAAFATPILGFSDYYLLCRTWHLQGVQSRREPVPPERFYWKLQRPKIRRTILLAGLASIGAWWNAATLPACLELSVVSVAGWLNALVGIGALSRFGSATCLFFKASQWFDVMTPNLVGLCRLAMYHLSDNYEYLGQRKRDVEKEKVF